jgi:hypothetical protein
MGLTVRELAKLQADYPDYRMELGGWRGQGYESIWL